MNFVAILKSISALLRSATSPQTRHECATCDAEVPAAHMVCASCHADGCRVVYVSGIGGTKAVEATWPKNWPGIVA